MYYLGLSNFVTILKCLNPVDISKIINDIKNNNNELTTLELVNYKLNLFLALLLQAHWKKTTLTKLTLWCNLLGQDDGVALRRAREEQYSRHDYWIQLCWRGFGAAIARALEKNTTLMTLE